MLFSVLRKVNFLFGGFAVKMDAFHFDDVIKVHKVNFNGSKYDKVSRIEAESQDGNTFCQLVIIRELYSVHPNELYRMVISEVDKENPDESDFAGYLPEGKQKSPADQFEFIMQGKVYNVSTDTSGSDTKAVVHISFGGLQFMLKSDPAKLQRFKRGQRVLLLMTKV
ncbi:PREDICTED: DNA-directed RNA polymerases II, IV and V subunit 8B-like isoform X2 [Nicotiana attenuata]|uniref:DNA-directed RNA polymerases II, IV and V subunit 8B-like isoform X2 n=2 Tax=Nicotiana attenuata TaxID=49451 RepID=UPI0009057364|nr:PREDICTED: DNA-directed RNA polymerases II, IV and V subunit 8B-like isoform X2 [Nicotiana attenuata]